MTKDNISKKLEKLSIFSVHRKNDFQAVAINTEIFERAKVLVKQLEDQNMLDGWNVFPTYHGTIQLERNLPYINIELCINGQYEIYTEKPWHFECRLKDTKEVIDFIKYYVSNYNNEQSCSIT